MLLACWFIPLALLSIIMLFLVSSKVNEQLRSTIETSAEKAIEISQMRIEETLQASKNASYNTVIRDSYGRYLEDGNKQQLYQEVSLYLTQQYRYNTDFKSTILYFTEDPDTLYFTFSNGSGSTYDSVKDFERYAKKEVQQTAQRLDTYTGFLDIKGKIYMVRNLVDSRFEPYAVLVMELNPQEILGSLESVWGYEESCVFIDGVPLLGSWAEDRFAYEIEGRDFSSIYLKGQKESYVYKRTACDRHRVAYAIRLDNRKILAETYSLPLLLVIFCIFMIPLVAMVFLFFHKKVTKPIKRLAVAYGEIEQEKYGYHIPQMDVDQEFYYLYEAFNRMSDKLQYQFEKIYLEELALRDADIMTLQSQINPDFLKNTLELIDCEAGKAGNQRVSGMIEALSVMLGASMDKKHPTVSLAEEMTYVDAYLYIVKERFGEKLSVEKEIDESLLQEEVPKLIIQPVLENALEQGADASTGRKVKLHIFKQEEMIHIEVWSDKTLTEQEREKIQRLLSEGDDQAEHSMSLGIQNVNKRLKIMYGEASGLTIESDKENHAISTLLVKIDE